MTADEFIRVASITLDEVRKAREQGADRERRRIRRAQAVNVAWLRKYVSATIANELDAATRAKKGKRK